MRTLGSLALGLTLALISTPAFATMTFISGNNCFPVQGSSVGYNQFGAHATTSAPAIVHCPMVLPDWAPGNNPPFTMTVNAYNRSTTSDLSCTLTQVDGSANIFASTTVATRNRGFFGSQSNAASGNRSAYPYLRCTIPGATANGLSHLVAVFFTY
jgi:hypothetical protein